ncbi:hypothetical protein [Kitasatospora aureofaciens]|uniref:hypothetical protein n=1 Tax=Kitasatospora aureofaciens TaxID=1894 RepID=UPI002730DBB1|nr:hypothetical protein [Kitasatospora aureofaciens]
MTQASAVRLTDRAKPTTMSVGAPGSPGTRSVWPTSLSGLPYPAASTTSPGRLGQLPFSSVTLSMPPAASARPAMVIGSMVSPGGTAVPGPGSGSTVTVANGPAEAVTPGACAESASWAAVARVPSNRAVRWAPVWAAKA